MKVRTVGIPGREYEIWIGEGVLARAGELVSRFLPPGEPAAVVTDQTVWGHYGEALTQILAEAGHSAHPIVLPPGEGNKSVEGLAGIWDRLARMGMNRNGLAIAFGGGVVGDLCGFAAATYMRGIRCLQIPTTLLAQVDSSVGGKTAINLPQGKNLAGVFAQPQGVLADTLLLKTLPDRELGCGMAEVIKCGAIASRELLRRVEATPDAAQLARLVDDCCRIKGEIVARDEREAHQRMVLNFGHTFGHAVEKHFGLSRFRHGEAVAVGMVMAALAGEAMGLTKPGTGEALERLLRLRGLPTGCPAGTDQFLPLMRLDKKSRGDRVSLALLQELGRGEIHSVSFEALERAMRAGESRWRTEDDGEKGGM